jgi:putative FmdB family regulatory protein
MPLFEYLCLNCGESSEILVVTADDRPSCLICGSRNLKKLISAHSQYTGRQSSGYPGTKDTSCCGSTPDHAGCAGPGSCCGKR